MVGTDGNYGDRTAMLAQEHSAGMAQQPNTPPIPSATAAPTGGQGGAPPGPGFGAASARPDEPVTNGVAVGPGAGPEALGYPTGQMGPANGAMTQMLSQFAPTDASGVVASLLARAQELGV